MTKPDGLSHIPPEDPQKAQYESLGIVNTPQIRLGSPVKLVKNGRQWSGFVISIDRMGPETDLIVQWISKPAGMPEKENLGLFKSEQLSWGNDACWEVDPSTVIG